MRDENVGDGGKDRGNERSFSFTWPVLALCALLIGITAVWILNNRERVHAQNQARVEILSAPQTVAVGEVMRVQAKVISEDGERPLPDRVVSVTVGPEPDVEILAITGGTGLQGEDEKATPHAMAGHVLGRTDAQGRVEVLMRVNEPGDFTVVAADSASKGSAAADIRAEAKGAGTPEPPRG